MQHHGGPTRLLDWSDGSLMALHFALRNKQGDDSDSIVYVQLAEAAVSITFRFVGAVLFPEQLQSEVFVLL